MHLALTEEQFMLKIQNIHVNVESGQPAEGTLIADRSGWTVKVALTTRGDAKI